MYHVLYTYLSPCMPMCRVGCVGGQSTLYIRVSQFGLHGQYLLVYMMFTRMYRARVTHAENAVSAHRCRARRF